MYKDMSNLFRDMQVGGYKLENFEITPQNLRDRQRGVYEIFLPNGKKEVVKDEIYNRISGYLVEVY